MEWCPNVRRESAPMSVRNSCELPLLEGVCCGSTEAGDGMTWLCRQPDADLGHGAGVRGHRAHHPALHPALVRSLRLEM